MSDSILTSVKKTLNLEEEYEAFDQEIILFINSSFATLHQLGVGPDAGFEITDKNSKWNDFLENDPRMNNVKSYIYLRVRYLFDPPTTSYLNSAVADQIKEESWRLVAQVRTEDG